jgi:hypothetical protein
MVLRELEHRSTPPVVRTWLSHLPQWIAVREVHPFTDPGLEGLDAGERDAIQLAKDENADL